MKIIFYIVIHRSKNHKSNQLVQLFMHPHSKNFILILVEIKNKQEEKKKQLVVWW